MITVTFIPWKPFYAKRMYAVTTLWLLKVRQHSRGVFLRGMLRGPHTGKVYKLKGGKTHRAAAPDEYPAKRSGNLVASLRATSDQTEAQIGTNMSYSKYLRTGTKHMERRKMSDDALKEGIARSGHPIGFVKWTRYSN